MGEVCLCGQTAKRTCFATPLFSHALRDQRTYLLRSHLRGQLQSLLRQLPASITNRILHDRYWLRGAATGGGGMQNKHTRFKGIVQGHADSFSSQLFTDIRVAPGGCSACSHSADFVGCPCNGNWCRHAARIEGKSMSKAARRLTARQKDAQCHNALVRRLLPQHIAWPILRNAILITRHVNVRSA
jgi:hypothetical protein